MHAIGKDNDKNKAIIVREGGGNYMQEATQAPFNEGVTPQELVRLAKAGMIWVRQSVCLCNIWLPPDQHVRRDTQQDQHKKRVKTEKQAAGKHAEDPKPSQPVETQNNTQEVETQNRTQQVSQPVETQNRAQEVCTACGKTAAMVGIKKLMKCSACTIEPLYCSAACQRACWGAHKAVCRENRKQASN